MKKTLLGSILLAATAYWAQSATITWGAPVNASAPTDVRTGGTLVDAQDPGNLGANRTINGVPFTAAGSNPFGQSYGGFGASASVTDPSYMAAVGDGSWDNAGTEPITLSGLVVGRNYEVQIWVSDIRGCCSSRTQIYDSDNSLSGAGSVSLAEGTSQFAVGTFIADGLTQAIFNNELDPAVGPQVNLFQLRDVTIPEPGAAFLVGLGAMSLLRRRRR